MRRRDGGGSEHEGGLGAGRQRRPAVAVRTGRTQRDDAGVHKRPGAVCPAGNRNSDEPRTGADAGMVCPMVDPGTPNIARASRRGRRSPRRSYVGETIELQEF